MKPVARLKGRGQSIILRASWGQWSRFNESAGGGNRWRTKQLKLGVNAIAVLYERRVIGCITQFELYVGDNLYGKIADSEEAAIAYLDKYRPSDEPARYQCGGCEKEITSGCYCSAECADNA